MVRHHPLFGLVIIAAALAGPPPTLNEQRFAGDSADANFPSWKSIKGGVAGALKRVGSLAGDNAKALGGGRARSSAKAFVGGVIKSVGLDASLEFNHDRKCVMCELLVELVVQRLRADSQLHYSGPPLDFPYTKAGGVFGSHGTMGQRIAPPRRMPLVPSRGPATPVVRPPPEAATPPFIEAPASIRLLGKGFGGGPSPGFGPGIRSLDGGGSVGSVVLGPLAPNAGR